MTQRSGHSTSPSGRPRLAVITNDAGDIIAIGPATGAVFSGDNNDEQIHVAFQPLEGQKLVEIEAFDELANPEARRELHETHRVDAKAGRIVRRRDETKPR